MSAKGWLSQTCLFFSCKLQPDLFVSEGDSSVAVVLEQAAADRAIVRITPTQGWEKQTEPSEKYGTGSYSNSRL